jgi:hypothetical protein
MKRMHERDRHFYEILDEGNPLRLYLDIEVYYACNPEYADRAYSTSKIRELHEYLISLLHEFFDHAPDAAGGGVGGVVVRAIRESDSSNAAKLSRHYTFECERGCFRDYVHIARFVDWAVTRLPASLYINKDEDGAIVRTWLIDTSVYTRNRCFRFIGNAKHEPDMETQPRFLWPVLGALGSDPTRDHDAITRAMFDAYSISQCVSEREKQWLWTIGDDAVCERSERYGDTRGLVGSANKRACVRLDARPLATASSGHAPQSVMRMARECFHQRNVRYFPEKHAFSCTYADGAPNSRYCAFINREHRSNNIIIVVTMYSPLAEYDRTWYQKCLDPSCDPNARTAPQRIPPEFQYLCDQYVDEAYFDEVCFEPLWPPPPPPQQ